MKSGRIQRRKGGRLVVLTTAYIDLDVAKALTARAAETNRSISEVVMDALRQVVGSRPPAGQEVTP